jgi:hypothetical protein
MGSSRSSLFRVTTAHSLCDYYTPKKRLMEDRGRV